MSARERDRGARAERAVVNYLRQNGWPDARRYLAGDGRQPGDVDFHPLVCLEVKDVAKNAWPSWCRQAASEAREGMLPVVVRRTRGVPDAGQWECRYEEDAFRAVVGDCAYWPQGKWHHVGLSLWQAITLAEFVSALRRFDVIDGAA